MQERFYLSIGGDYVGPYLSSEIVELISTGKHAWTDYLYDEEKEEWIMVMEHPEFSAKMPKEYSRKLTSHPKSDKSELKGIEGLKEKAWFILKEGNNYGPFSKIEIVQMLQEKTLFEFDYVWTETQSAWKRVSDVEEFSFENIRNIRDSGSEDVKEVFFRRRHVRVDYGCSLIIHNNKAVYKGQSLEVSAGGAGIVVESGSFEPGQQIYLHFKPGDGVPPFNAICEVVSKTNGTTLKGYFNPVKYGVKFKSIPQNVRESIRTYATKAA